MLRGLKRATPFLRSEIASRLTLRAVPELAFSYDDTPQKASRVDELLRQHRRGTRGRTRMPDG